MKTDTQVLGKAVLLEEAKEQGEPALGNRVLLGLVACMPTSLYQ